LSYSIKIDYPEQSDAYEVYIDGLGTLKNGTTTDLTDQQLAAFASYGSYVDHEYDENGRIRLIPTAGPSLEEAFQNNKGITVLVDGKEILPPAVDAALAAIVQMLEKQKGATQ
jgi:hypothetical protein